MCRELLVFSVRLISDGGQGEGAAPRTPIVDTRPHIPYLPTHASPLAVSV